MRGAEGDGQLRRVTLAGMVGETRGQHGGGECTGRGFVAIDVAMDELPFLP